MYDNTDAEYVDALNAVNKSKLILNTVELAESTFINPDIVTLSGNTPAESVVKFENKNDVSEMSSAPK